ncbi:MAG: hypothetical protein ABEJ34_06330 [Haloferacaceae archaeon]
MATITTLFVGLFVAAMGWVFVATAVAVGVEQGLQRYHGESSPVVQVGAGDGSGGDGTA